MADQDIQVLEQLVLSDPPSLTSLIPGSEFYFYFHLLSLLDSGSFSSPQFLDLNQRFQANYPHSPLAKSVQIRLLLRRYDLETGPEEKSWILDELNSRFLHYSFEYPPPSSVSEVSKRYPHVLDQGLLTLDVDKAERDLEYFETVSREEYPLLTIDRMTDPVFGRFLRNGDVHFPSGVVGRLAKLSPEMFEVEGFPALRTLTIDQLEQLFSLRPDLWESLDALEAFFMLQFPATEPGTDQEKVDFYMKLANFAGNLSGKFDGFKVKILSVLLSVLSRTGEYREDLFFQYIKLHGAGALFNTEKSIKNEIISSYFSQDELPEEQLIGLYLENILKTASDFNAFSPYLKPSYLDREFAKAKLFTGCDPMTTNLSPRDIRDLSDSVVLDISPSNPKSFLRTSPVVLKIHIKNVPRLLVRVIELNTTAFYLQNHSPVPADINIEGLEPLFQQFHDFPGVSPFVKTDQIVKIDGLTDRAGFFIVDFIGNGKCSRAFIKKGTLKLVCGTTAAGHQMTVLDEENNVSANEKSGLFVDRRFYPVLKEKKSVIVPFKDTEGDNWAVLTDGVIADLAKFTHKKETYELKTGFFICEEGLIAGTTASIALKPVLYVSGIEGPKILMQKPSIRITTTDFDGFSTSKTYENLRFSNESDMLQVEFLVPGSLSTLAITFSCQVSQITKSDPLSLSVNHQILLNSQNGTMVIPQIALRKRKKDYFLHVFGRNGEAKPDQIIKFAVSIGGVRTTPIVLLSSDESGDVKLGELWNVFAVMATCGIDSDLEKWQRWDLSLFKHRVEYPRSIQLCEGDVFELPFYQETESVYEAELAAFNTLGRVIYMCPKHLRYDLEKRTVFLENLTPGKYALRLQTQAPWISIEVLKGVHWMNSQYILTDSQVIGTRSQYQELLIKEIDSNEDCLTLRLSGAFENAKIDLIFHNFISESFSEIYSSLRKKRDFAESETAKNASGASWYVPGWDMSEEITYVLDRQRLPRFVGNHLPKPQLLLRPILTQDMETIVQKAVRRSSDYQDDDMEADKKGGKHRKLSRNHGEGVKLGLDFLRNQAKFLFGEAVDETGKIIIKIPEGGYSLVTVFASNEDFVTSLSIDIADFHIETKDLRLKTSFPSDRNLAEIRRCSVVQTNAVLELTNLSNSSFFLIDSTAKLALALSSVSKTAKTDQKFEDWSFLWNWHTLSIEEKEGIYDRFYSHEMNVFLYMKDLDFFKNVVKPLIASKMEKTVIDRFLLGEELDDYLNPEGISDLNLLEQILIGFRTRESGGIALIQKVLAQTETVEKDGKAEQRLFDAVLKSNSLDSGEKDELNQFLEEEKAADMEKPAEKSLKESENDGFSHDGNEHFRLMASESEALPMKISKSLRRGAGLDDLIVKTATLECAQEFQKKSRFRIISTRGNRASPIQNQGLEFEEIPELDLETLIQERARQKPYYQQMDLTKEYAEMHYFGMKDIGKNKELTHLSPFWADFARSAIEGKLQVLSDSLLYATESLTAFVCALSFSSLPLQPSSHGFLTHPQGVHIKAASNLLAFHKTLESVSSASTETVLFCVQRYFNPQDPDFINSLGEREEKPALELVSGTVFTNRVIVVNASIICTTVNVLTQIPEGAVPIQPPEYQNTHILALSAYETKTIEYSFYFPEPGEFSQASACVSKDGVGICKSNRFGVRVKSRGTNVTPESFRAAVFSGDMEAILMFLETHNPFDPDVSKDLDSVLYLLSDPTHFLQLTTCLRRYQYFSPAIWSFGLFHHDAETVKELLQDRKDVIQEVGNWFSSSLLSTEKPSYRHLDFSPMVNARAYRLGGQARITNDRVNKAYFSILFDIAGKRKPTQEDWMTVIQYMIYQERIPEARTLVSRLFLSPSVSSPGQSPLQLQYDYLMSYLDPAIGRQVAPLYIDYPIPAWNSLFSDLRNLLISDDFPSSKTAENSSLISSDPDLSFIIENGIVKITPGNLQTFTIIRLYEIDVEILFSRNPFFMQETEIFTFVSPNVTWSLPPSHEPILIFSLPAPWGKRNVFVEVESGGKKIFQTNFACRLTVQVLESFGLVHVIDEFQTGLSRTYIKVFARTGAGVVEFYKDGYTDVRGKFDYVSLNTGQLDSVQEFALLVVHHEAGAKIITAHPPKR